jgi:hypothetical protein
MRKEREDENQKKSAIHEVFDFHPKNVRFARIREKTAKTAPPPPNLVQKFRHDGFKPLNRPSKPRRDLAPGAMASNQCP